MKLANAYERGSKLILLTSRESHVEISQQGLPKHDDAEMLWTTKRCASALRKFAAYVEAAP